MVRLKNELENHLTLSFKDSWWMILGDCLSIYIYIYIYSFTVFIYTYELNFKDSWSSKSPAALQTLPPRNDNAEIGRNKQRWLGEPASLPRVSTTNFVQFIVPSGAYKLTISGTMMDQGDFRDKPKSWTEFLGHDTSVAQKSSPEGLAKSH